VSPTTDAPAIAMSETCSVRLRPSMSSSTFCSTNDQTSLRNDRTARVVMWKEERPPPRPLL
jgi:hypothetical protein